MDDTCHLNGTARMGDDPATSVVNADCRSWDIPNLWVCDGSVFPTVGGVNPSLTIQAIACRTGDRIAELARAGRALTGYEHMNLPIRPLSSSPAPRPASAAPSSAGSRATGRKSP